MINSIFDHIAFATNDTDETMKVISLIGFDEVLFYKQPLIKFNSYITKLKSKQGSVVELVEPSSQQSVVKKILKGREATIYHSAFLSKDLNSTLELLRSAGTIIVTEPMSIPYAATTHHKEYKTCHVFHPYVGLFEVTGPLFGAIND